jgi:DNA-binding NtrC family response regulator
MTPESPCRVLLVDDEVDFLATVTKRLRHRKLEVQAVHDGPAALIRLAERSFDVVVLDVKMPGMDGLEALRRIKAAHPLTEVIMLTGHASVQVAVEGMQIGAFDYLMKPVELNELLYKIEDAHKRKRIREAELGSAGD